MPKALEIYALFMLIFITINIVIYFLIQLKATEKIFKRLCLYWIALLFVTIVEGVFIEGKLALSMVFFSNFIPIFLMSSCLLEMFDHKLKLKKYLSALPVAIAATYTAYLLDAPFFIVCLPSLIINCGPMIELIKFVFFSSGSDEEKKIEKIMIGVVSGSGLLSSIYYALYRFNPTETQYFIGFGSAFVSYLICSILLPILCIQIINRKRTDYLENQVSLRTNELSKSKLEKEKLLRVLVHDISNPLQALMLQIPRMKDMSPDSHNSSALSYDRIYKNVLAIKDITTYIREYEAIVSGKSFNDLEEVSLQECLNEVQEMFTERFANKNINLKINNMLSPKTKIRVGKTPFIHSIVSNLISNALKFSKPGSNVTIFTYEHEEKIVMEVVDQGVGISQETMSNLFDISFSTTRLGTIGESGTGLGMPIVKAYTTMFGGSIDVVSSQDEQDSGTTIKVCLPKIDAPTPAQSSTYLQ